MHPDVVSSTGHITNMCSMRPCFFASYPPPSHNYLTMYHFLYFISISLHFINVFLNHHIRLLVKMKIDTGEKETKE